MDCAEWKLGLKDFAFWFGVHCERSVEACGTEGIKRVVLGMKIFGGIIGSEGFVTGMGSLRGLLLGGCSEWEGELCTRSRRLT